MKTAADIAKDLLNKPYRERAELFAVDHKGRVLGGFYPDKAFGTFGGGVDKGEDPAEAAAREFKEESGYKVVNVRPAGVAPHVQEWEQQSNKPSYANNAKFQERLKDFRGSKTHYFIGDIVGDKGVRSKVDASYPFKDVKFRPVSSVVKQQEKAMSSFSEEDKARAQKRLAVLKALNSLKGPSMNKTASEIADIVIEKIAETMSWKESLMTNPFKEHEEDLSQVIPASSALGGLGLSFGSGALVKRKLKEGHPAIPSVSDHEKLLASAEATRNIPRDITTLSSALDRGEGATYFGKAKGDNSAVVRVSPKANVEELSHELGHAEMMYGKGAPTVGQHIRRKLIKAAPVLRNPNFFVPMSALGMGMSEVGYNRDNTALTDAGLALAVGPQLPTLLEEGIASIKGYNMMRAAGMNPKLRKYLLPFATYGGMTAAAGAYPAYMSYKQHTRED